MCVIRFNKTYFFVVVALRSAAFNERAPSVGRLRARFDPRMWSITTTTLDIGSAGRRGGGGGIVTIRYGVGWRSGVVRTKEKTRKAHDIIIRAKVKRYGVRYKI